MNPTEVVTALAKILEGWAAMQESQALAQAEQLEMLQVQAGLQMQALVQLAGGGEAAATRQNTPRIHIPNMTAEDDAQAFLEVFEVGLPLAQGGMGSVPIVLAVRGSTAG